MAGWSSARLTALKPAVRVEAAWKRPARARIPGARLVTVGSLSYMVVSQAGYNSREYTLSRPRTLTSRMMKNIQSTPFRITSTQNSHQVASDGKSKVKHRRGWSSKNRSSSQIPLPCGTQYDETQITKRSMQGNPVFPIMMRKVPNRRGNTAV
jgi:hypothetical protein